MVLSVCFLFFLFSLVNSQNAAVPPGVVCTTCACADRRVDCTKKDIRTSFSVEDWKALESFSPTEIDLSWNHITSLSEFPELPVQNLTVSNNEVESIEPGCFKHLTETLVSLDLSNNIISTSSLDMRVFMWLALLEFLWAAGDPRGAESVKHLTETLVSLDLSNNIISTSSLEMGVFMTKLTNDVPNLFIKLKYLSLAKNDIHSLPKDLFINMIELTHLDLSGNPLVYIDSVTLGTISDLAKLRNLTLNSCDLESIPEGMFRRLRKLQGLDLSGNRFTTIPARINEATNLLYLKLDRNPWETINDNTPFSKLNRLRELYIRHCSKLKSISEGALGGLESLSILHISYNPRLSTLNPKFLVWQDDYEVERRPLIKELHLNNNNITEISAYYLDRWNLLEDGDFTNNPYDCDCDSQWMVDVLVPLLQELPSSNEDMTHMICKTPEPFRGLTYVQVMNSTRQLVCTDKLMEPPITDAAIMLGIMIGVFVTFPMVILVVLLWRRGIFFKCRKKVIETEEEKDMF